MIWRIHLNLELFAAHVSSDETLAPVSEKENGPAKTTAGKARKKSNGKIQPGGNVPRVSKASPRKKSDKKAEEDGNSKAVALKAEGPKLATAEAAKLQLDQKPEFDHEESDSDEDHGEAEDQLDEVVEEEQTKV